MKKEGGRERSRDRRKIKMPEDGKMDQTKKVLCRVLMASLLVAAYFGKNCYIKHGSAWAHYFEENVSIW